MEIDHPLSTFSIIEFGKLEISKNLDLAPHTQGDQKVRKKFAHFFNK
jgi:hypothetical protein